ncbi:hypothetical protein ACW9HQ_45410, partial [Nocardia gipuzkoensis]
IEKVPNSARLVRVRPTQYGNAYIFELNPVYGGYNQFEISFEYHAYFVYLINESERRQVYYVSDNDWGDKTVKQLLVAELADASRHTTTWTVTDWGGFVVPDDKPARG